MDFASIDSFFYIQNPTNEENEDEEGAKTCEKFCNIFPECSSNLEGKSVNWLCSKNNACVI